MKSVHITTDVVISSTNKTDIVLKVSLNTITVTFNVNKNRRCYRLGIGYYHPIEASGAGLLMKFPLICVCL